MYGKIAVNRGDVWAVDLEPSVGSEMNKRNRPCLVVTNDTANRYARVITIVPLTTTAPSKPYPFIVEIPKSANMPADSWADCAHVRAIDKARLGRYYTSLDSATMSRIDTALRVQLDLSSRSIRE